MSKECHYISFVECSKCMICRTRDQFKCKSTPSTGLISHVLCTRPIAAHHNCIDCVGCKAWIQFDASRLHVSSKTREDLVLVTITSGCSCIRPATSRWLSRLPICLSRTHPQPWLHSVAPYCSSQAGPNKAVVQLVVAAEQCKTPTLQQ